MKKVILLMLGLSGFNIANAQFTTFNNGGIQGSTNMPPNAITSIGIGDFRTPNVAPNARLHVNNFRLAQPNGALNGFLFRTDGNNIVENKWQLFTGPAASSVNEKFKLFVPANSNDVSLQVTQNGNMFFNTNSTQRMIINGNRTPLINSATVNTSGFVGIGDFQNIVSPLRNTGPWSMLHLQGLNNTGFSGNGWRTWMKTGAYITENSDAMYVGMKNEGTNHSDAIINWSDDHYGPGSSTGPDNLRFIFTAASTGNGANNNSLDGNSLNGYEFMRMSASPNQVNGATFPVGNVGIGPVFTSTAAPQNRLHINSEEALAVFMQISNADITNGTGQTNADGLHMGYPTTTSINKEARIDQKENDRLTFFTHDKERIRVMHIGALNNGVLFNPAGLPNDRTRVSITHNPASPVTRPLSLLHLGYNTTANNAAWRPWMDVGTFTSAVNGARSMYMGIDVADVVLNWGSNTGTNNMRVIYTTGPTGNAAGTNGVEAMRMRQDLASNLIFTGIGGDPAANKYFGGVNNPTATLEVNSKYAGAGSNNGNLSASGIGNATGWAGLRFTDLNSSSVTQTNPGPGVLSVNEQGDVIYVPDNGLNCWDLNGNGVFDVATEDKNGNSIPDAGDCAGPQGATGDTGPQGPSGTNGLNSLTKSTAIGPGIGGCTYGGTMVESGQDSNNNGVLDAGEVTSTSYVCDGALLNADNGTQVVTSDGTTNFSHIELGGQLHKNTSINLNGNNLSLTGSSTTSANQVSIGNNTTYLGTFNSSANNVTGSLGSIAGSFENNSTVNNYTIGVLSNSSPSKPTSGEYSANVAFKGMAANAVVNFGIDISAGDAASNGISVGGNFDVTSGLNLNGQNTGVHGHVSGATGDNYAVSGLANSTVGRNFGGTFDAVGPNSNFGLQATTGGNGSSNKAGYFISPRQGVALSSSVQYNAAINAIAPVSLNSWAGDFAGNVRVTGDFDVNGNITHNGTITYTSDAMFKNDIQDINDPINIIKQLKPRTYYMDTSNQYNINFSSKKQYGLIAQEVEAILPELVGSTTKPADRDSLGNIITQEVTYKNLNYNAFIAILLKGVQEQEQEIDSLKAADKSSKAQIDSILAILSHLPPGLLNGNHRTSGNDNSDLTVKNVELGGNTVVLEQNVPNPFAEETVINYFIPDDIKFAQVLFYDNLGRIIKTVDINEKGKGQLNVFASSLGNGIYSYSLVVDGKTVDTKKMVKTK